MSHRLPLTLCAVALVLQASPKSEHLHKLWEIDLNRIIRPVGVDHISALPIFALRFSPDGSNLAVVADLFEHQGRGKSYLLVLKADGGLEGIKQFVVNSSVRTMQGPSWDHPDLSWDPSGDAILVTGTMTRIPGGASCEVPEGTVFIRDNLAITREKPNSQRSPDVSHFVFYGSNCERNLAPWIVEDDLRIVESSTERGLVYLNAGSRPMALVIDPVAEKIVHAWQSNGPGGSGHFADSGHAICGGEDVASKRKASVSCWDVDTGKLIATAPSANGGIPMATAERAARVVLSDYIRSWDAQWSEHQELFRGRIAWDFKRNQELLSWKPGSQAWDTGPSFHNSEPVRFAMSPDGKYVAEGSNGVVHLYQIEP